MNHLLSKSFFALALALATSTGLTAQATGSSAPGKSEDQTKVVEPLQETQKVLRDKKLRTKAIQEEGGKAQEADAQAERIVGASNKDDMYDLTADLMALLDKESGGDADKMMKILAEAQNNPEAFYNRFPPEQKAKLQRIIEKMPKPSKP